MKIIYFHQYFCTPKGSNGNRSYWMAKALVDAGHEVHVVCGNTERSNTGLSGGFHKNIRTGRIDNIAVTEVKINYSGSLTLVGRSMAFLKMAMFSIKIALTHEYDLVFCTSTPLTASLPGIFAKIFRRKKFVFEVRDLWPELPKAMGVVTNPIVLMAMSILEWLSYRFADVCIGLSPGIVDGIRKRNPKNQMVHLISNGCDLDTVKHDVKSTVRIKELNSSDFVAMYTGAHGEANGLDAIVDCAGYLKNIGNSRIKLVIVGEGKHKARLQERAISESLPNCIFLPSVSKIQLDQYLSRADICLMILKNVPAFYYGTSPNKFFDYISAGKPVLCNHPGWLTDMISEYNLGVSVTPDNPKEFGDALIKLSEESDAIEEMGENAFRLACSKFSRDKLAQEFVVVLSSMK